MRRKLFKNLLTVVCLLCSITALAHDFEVDGIYYNITSETDKTVKVTYAGENYYAIKNEYTDSIVLPELVTYNGTTYSVTSIGFCTFSGCKKLSSVSIPNTVTSIGYDAFYDCTSLISVTIGNNIRSIGDYAFYGCVGLTTVNFNAEYCTRMGSSTYPAFTNCNNITTLNIGKNVKKIPDYAFSGCRNLSSVIIPNSVTLVGDSAFYNCYGISSIVIGNNVSEIGNYSFFACKSITSVSIPNSVVSIGNYAFKDCSELTKVEIGNGVSRLGSGAFSMCHNIISVYITDLLSWCNIYFGDIDGNPLYNAKNLYLNNELLKGDIVIPNGVDKIGAGAFYKCTSITSITIPHSATYIDFYAFYGCSGLTSINIPKNISWIGRYAFSGCSNLESVNIQKGATIIGKFAFLNCTKLVLMEIPNSVTSINDGAFKGCTGLTSISIPNSVISIGPSAFEGCTGLSSTTIGNNVTSIGDFAFYGCVSLKELTITDGNNELVLGNNDTYNGLFNDCPIETLYLGRDLSYSNSMRSGYSPFYDNQKLSNITISDSVTKIPNYLFWGCTGLTSVTIPNSVTSIGNSAFRDCIGLTSIEIPKYVTTIGEDAFLCCNNINSVKWDAINCNASEPFKSAASTIMKFEFGADVECIPTSLCKDMIELYEIMLHNKVKILGERVFSGCIGLQKITLGYNVNEIGDFAFEGCERLREIYAYPLIPPKIYINTFSPDINDKATLHSVKGYKDVYAQAKYWKYFLDITDDLTGVEGVKANDSFLVTVAGGILSISGVADNPVVNIYSTNGSLLHHTTASQVSGISLPRGIYLIQVNGTTKEVAM